MFHHQVSAKRLAPVPILADHKSTCLADDTFSQIKKRVSERHFTGLSDSAVKPTALNIATRFAGDRDCYYCGGSGQRQCGTCDGRGSYSGRDGRRQSCLTCRGTGKVACNCTRY